MQIDPDDPDLRALLEFWFSDTARRHWFDSTPDFDAEVARRLMPLHVTAAADGLAAWAEGPHGCLGLALLLDQVPRNVFRDDPRAFATDAAARAVTRHALSLEFDAALTQPERMFLYLPLEHSEDLDDQEECVRRMRQLDSEPDWLRYAEMHRDVIARFGRFPHRNAVLGRTSRPEEDRFLADQGPGW